MTPNLTNVVLQTPIIHSHKHVAIADWDKQYEPVYGLVLASLA
jgi:hypothetical protein